MFKNKAGLILLMGLLMVLLLSVAIFAHCIWVEVPREVSPLEDFKVLAFYAHPDDPLEEREITQLSLYAIDPDGVSHPIQLVKGKTYEQASLNFSRRGQWFLVLERQFTRYRLQEIRDIGKSVFFVGKKGTWVHDPVGLSLELNIVSERVQPDGLIELVFSVDYEGIPLEGAEIEVFRSLKDSIVLYEEVDELVTDSEGQVLFTVDPQFRYVFETGHRLPAREAQGVRALTTEVRFRSTLFIGN